jgi:hypothetical protein
MGALPLEKEIEYPTSDGEPMAETQKHMWMLKNLLGPSANPALKRDVRAHARWCLFYSVSDFWRIG